MKGFYFLLTITTFQSSWAWIAPKPIARRFQLQPLYTSFEPVFDFRNTKTIDNIDRLDDAIMGGISTSSVQPADGFARWVGVCRTDGGGFCGFRTNPFEDPLRVGNADGFYVNCKLNSDNEPERRVWKMTTRLKPDRGEQLFQAPFVFESSDTFQSIKVPFDSFRYVRGPRMIPDGPKFNATSGIYQIGMTMSKFAFGLNMTTLDNFRDGFFELQIQEIGVYKNKGEELNGVVLPTVLTKMQAKRKRPVIMKVVTPLAKVFFSEQSQRRKSAMRILREERNYSRLQAILWGWRIRGKNRLRSTVKTLSILSIDTFRAVVSTFLKVVIVYPILIIRKIVGLLVPKKQTTRST